MISNEFAAFKIKTEKKHFEDKKNKNFIRFQYLEK